MQGKESVSDDMEGEEEGERDDIYINILEKRSGMVVDAYINDNPITFF